MKVKKIDDDELKLLMDEIRVFAKTRRKLEKDENASIVSNKDILFYFLAQIAEIDRRMAVVETKQKMACWFIGIILAIFGVAIACLNLLHGF